jgi:hypothetical protein
VPVPSAPSMVVTGRPTRPFVPDDGTGDGTRRDETERHAAVSGVPLPAVVAAPLRSVLTLSHVDADSPLHLSNLGTGTGSNQ